MTFVSFSAGQLATSIIFLAGFLLLKLVSYVFDDDPPLLAILSLFIDLFCVFSNAFAASFYLRLTEFLD